MAPPSRHNARFAGHTTIPVVPLTYSPDHRRQRLHAVSSGHVTLADLATYIAARVKDGVYDYDQLIDFSDTVLDLVPDDVLDMVRKARVNLAEKPIPYTAIVARPGTATYGLARQLAVLFDFDGASVHIAETLDDARAWLDERRSGERQISQRQGD